MNSSKIPGFNRIRGFVLLLVHESHINPFLCVWGENKMTLLKIQWLTCDAPQTK